MIKKIAWNTFKNTGDINTFLELKQIQDIEEKVENNENNVKNELNKFSEQIGEQNGNNKNEWYNNI